MASADFTLGFPCREVSGLRPNTRQPVEPKAMVSPRSWGGSKRALDWILALLGLVLGAPVLLFLAALVKLTSRGPAFYTQCRVGKDGKLFTLYKLRTMAPDAEARTGPVWSQPGDPRTTWVGRFLRKTHLDELPQLLNVLLGQMSLVGPRPERPEFVRFLQSKIAGYDSRQAVRPGITGLAQLRLPPDGDLGGVRLKLACDRYYIAHLSPWLDFRVLLCTGLVMLWIPLGWSRWILHVPDPLDVSALPFRYATSS